MKPLALVLFAMMLPGSARSQAPSPPKMMTDSPEYCAHLASEMVKIRNRRPLTIPYARDLADEGTRLCDKGQYRGGVARLRRALMLMRTTP